MRCPNCGYNGYQGGNESCFQCGQSALIGPGPDDYGVQSGSGTAVHSEDNNENPTCPECGACPPVFNGWHCTECGHTLSSKARKAQPRVLSPEESSALRKRLGISD